MSGRRPSSLRRDVLIAIDGSFHAENASAWYATHLAHPGDTVYLVHVISSAKKNKNKVYEVTDEMKIRVEEIIGKHKEIIRKTIKQCSAKATRGLRVRSNSVVQEGDIDEDGSAGSGDFGEIVLDAHVLFGDPREELTGFVEENGCDMVIMGSRGLGTVKKTIMGSVSEHCMHQCHCPVIVVRETISAESKKLVNKGAFSLP